MTYLQERLAREMCEVEDWIDSTQQQFSTFLAGSGSSRRRSSFILSQACMDTVTTILQQYDTRGFKKRRIQDSASKSSSRRFVITEKAPTRALSWLKAATTAFTFKTLLRHCAKRALTPRSLNVKLGPRRKGHKGRAVWLA